MAYAAITYRVRPGHEQEIRDIFANFARPDSPILHDEDGRPSGFLLGTGLFLKDGLVVRVIHYEGRVEDVARHMSVQEGVREAERALAPYLVTPRDTSTPEGFLEHFGSASMPCVQQFSLPPQVADELRRTVGSAAADVMPARPV